MRFAPLLATVFVLLFSSVAWAEDKAMADFIGQWVGSGVSKDGPAANQSRDGEVVISKSADGFKINWTTMRTQIDDQASSVVKTSSLTFKSTEKPNVFHGLESGDPLKGKKAIWATISGSTLKIQQFIVEADGAWTIQMYDRTLTSPTTMDVTFKRVTNGEVARQASLKLTKAP